jgi:hypothetical protein
MDTHSITVVLIAAVAAAAIGLAAAPVSAQQPPTNPTTPKSATIAKKKPVRQAIASEPPAARVTVRKRSYLDPGTETKTHAEHFLDYAFPLTNSPHGMDRFLNDYNITSTRSPLPSCLDLAGFCR